MVPPKHPKTVLVGKPMVVGCHHFRKHPNRSSKTTKSESLESDQIPSEIPSATKLCWANLSPRRCVLWLKKLGKTSHSSFDEMMIGGIKTIYILYIIYTYIIPWARKTYMFRGFYGKKPGSKTFIFHGFGGSWYIYIFPDAQCMAYLPTFTINVGQM